MVALGTPKTAAQVAETLKDPEKLKQLVQEDKLDDYLNGYVEHQEEVTEKQLDEAKAEGMVEFYKAAREGGGKRLPMGEGGPGPDGEIAEWDTGYIQGQKVQAGWGTEEWTKAQLVQANYTRKLSDTHGFKSPRDYYKAIWHIEQRTNGPDPRLKDLSINIGADGGYLIPEALRAQLLNVPLESVVVRPRAFLVPMETLTVPFPTIDDVSHATNVFGGVTGNWTAENVAITESQPTFGRTVLTAHKLAIYTEVPNELFQDSIISLEAFLNQIFPQALGYFEDDGFLVGNGAGRPLGALSTSNTALVTSTRDTTGAVVWEDCVNMYARMLPTSLGSAVWVINQEVFPQLATMALTVGTGGSAVWLANGVGGPPATILGRPVIITEKVPALGSQADISFVDFRQYLLGDRQTVTMMTSPHFKFQQDQTAIRATERVDGQPWMRSALTPRNGTNTLSPYVALAA